jgi:hypothetical protein
MVRTLTFSYNHILKVLAIILAITFGLALSNTTASIHKIVIFVLLLPKIFLTFEKGLVELDDSYVAKRGCPLFPLLPHVAQNQNVARHRSVHCISPQNAQRLCPSKKVKIKTTAKNRQKRNVVLSVVYIIINLSYHHNIMHPLTETTYHSPTTAKNEQP